MALSAEAFVSLQGEGRFSVSVLRSCCYPGASSLAEIVADSSSGRRADDAP
jgi:hypothetical protein